jgi:cell wall-associated NlpC family hydrolase
VYSHTADQGRTSCAVVDVGYDPGHVGPFGYTRAAATDIANIAVGEGYQWAGGCYDNDDRDAKPNAYPRETKSTLGEGPDCSGLVWRVWRESNYAYPNDNSFYFWGRSTYDHGPYNTYGFK